jgi:type II secretory pathway predicted ATPase ExeA
MRRSGVSRVRNKSKQPLPFSGRDNSELFYSTVQHQRALATIRYGIEARKGLIVFTGDAGVGKTTVLHQLKRILNPDVTCLWISDPHLSFAEVQRLILSSLDAQPDFESDTGVPRQSEDPLHSHRRCQSILRSQLEMGRIVALAFDNAQHLCDETFDYLLKNFLDIEERNPEKNLLQVLLAGRPELKDHLFKPHRRSLIDQIVVECRLEPLNEAEIGHYIDHQVRAGGLPVELFDHEAARRIALYSRGKPQLVNSVCDRALQMTEHSPRKQITAEIVDAAAKDLDLWQPIWVRKNASEEDSTEIRSSMTHEHDETFSFRLDDNDTTEMVGQTFLSLTRASGRMRRWLLVLLILIPLGGGAAWLQGAPVTSYVADWGGKLSEIIRGYQQAPAQSRIDPPTPPSASQDVASTAVPSPDIPLPTSEETVENHDPPSEFEKQGERPVAPPPIENPSATNPETIEKKPSFPARLRRQETPRVETGASRQNLESEIAAAMRNRAIMGIEASVIDDTVYLDGRVASTRQKNAAERAARGVSGVKKLRNRIVVSSD